MNEFEGDGVSCEVQKKNIPKLLLKNGDLLTLNREPGVSVYGERLVNVDGVEYRVWNPRRSKLAALIHISREGETIPSWFPIGEKTNLLYLGASTGTTLSHLSDLIDEGVIFAVEISRRSCISLGRLASRRPNIIPILGDARDPNNYAHLLSQVDVIYQDVSQRDQVEILSRNASRFMKSGGLCVFFLKTRSVNAASSSSEIIKWSKEQMNNFRILLESPLEPFHMDHWGMMLEFRRGGQK